MIIKPIHFKPKLRRLTSWLLSMFLLTPAFAAGCGGRNVASPPSVDSSPTAVNPNENVQTGKKPGLSNTQKIGITLVGAAALYYLYNQHKKAQAQTGAQGQYYLSKNGRVYYRDAQHRAHWVTPPSQGIQVPAEEAQQYQQFQGYNNRTTGRDLTNLPEAQTSPSY
jgi:hypothetical protein